MWQNTEYRWVTLYGNLRPISTDCKNHSELQIPISKKIVPKIRKKYGISAGTVIRGYRKTWTNVDNHMPQDVK